MVWNTSKCLIRTKERKYVALYSSIISQKHIPSHVSAAEQWEDGPHKISGLTLWNGLWCMRKALLQSVDTFLCVLKFDVQTKLLPDKHFIGEGRPGTRRQFPPSQKPYYWPWVLIFSFTPLNNINVSLCQRESTMLPQLKQMQNCVMKYLSEFTGFLYFPRPLFVLMIEGSFMIKYITQASVYERVWTMLTHSK